MLCPTCKHAGLKSQVYPLGSYVTCMGYTPYYDEEGRYHVHDPNHHHSRYTCSNGHTWVEDRIAPCPVKTCGYGREPAIVLEAGDE